MNILDIFIGVPIIWMAYRGFSKGFIIEITTLIGLVVGIYAAIHFSYFTTDILKDFFTLEKKYMSILSFAVTFIAVVILIVFTGRILEKFVSIIALGLIDKIIGGLFGIIKAALIVSVLLFIITSFDTKHKIISEKTKANSVFFEPVASIIPTILPMIEFDKINIPLPDDSTIF
ncbi:MAG: CvpA family protein [Bacteroidota bacterium]|nr:CvpA family protein [Bacteroidota bacterium]